MVIVEGIVIIYSLKRFFAALRMTGGKFRMAGDEGAGKGKEPGKREENRSQNRRKNRPGKGAGKCAEFNLNESRFLRTFVYY